MCQFEQAELPLVSALSVHAESILEDNNRALEADEGRVRGTAHVSFARNIVFFRIFLSLFFCSFFLLSMLNGRTSVFV